MFLLHILIHGSFKGELDGGPVLEETSDHERDKEKECSEEEHTEDRWSSDATDRVLDEHGERSKIIFDVPVTVPIVSTTPHNGSWVHYGWLSQQLPGREAQLQLLLTLLGEVCCCCKCD